MLLFHAFNNFGSAVAAARTSNFRVEGGFLQACENWEDDWFVLLLKIIFILVLIMADVAMFKKRGVLVPKNRDVPVSKSAECQCAKYQLGPTQFKLSMDT